MINEIKKDLSCILNYLKEEYNIEQDSLREQLKILHINNVMKVYKMYQTLETEILSDYEVLEIHKVIKMYYNVFLKFLPDKAFGGISTAIPNSAKRRINA